MPRRPRQKSAGLVHHVVHRGINRQTIFHDAADYQVFLRTLAKAAEKFGAKVLAYCLMTNHLHLMIEDVCGSLSELMHCVNGFYTAMYNKRYQCQGALLRGRYYSTPVIGTRYELILFRYIHLNPVKAGLSSSPAGYRWSSYRAYLERDTDIPVAKQRMLQKLSDAGFVGENIDSWVNLSVPSMDAKCSAENVCRWLVGKESQGVKLEECEQASPSPLTRIDEWTSEQEKRQQTFAQEREELLVQVCSSVAHTYGLLVHELVAPKRQGSTESYRARDVAMLACRDRLQATYQELSFLFCLQPKSVGATLSRARLGQTRAHKR